MKGYNKGLSQLGLTPGMGWEGLRCISEDNLRIVMNKHLKFGIYSNHGIMVADTLLLRAIATSL